MIQSSLLMKQKQTHRLREWTEGCRGCGEWGKEVVMEFGMDMYTLPYLKWVSNKFLLYSTGNSQCYVAAWMGGMNTWIGENEYMYVCGWVPLLFWDTWNYLNIVNQLSVSQFSCSFVSDSLRPRESQHARPPFPSPTPAVYSNPCPLSQWCHPAISSSVVPFSSCPQSLPASGSFLMSQLFTWGGQSIGVSASASVLPVNTQDRSPLGWTGWTSLQSKGLSRVFSNTTVQKHQFFGAQLSSQSNSHIHTWPLEKP